MYGHIKTHFEFVGEAVCKWIGLGLDMFLEQWALEIAGRGGAVLRGCLQWSEEGRKRRHGRAENLGTGMSN